ncbi:MAG: hypothetical protein H7832_11970 [Magnetococcus sp. DMHC-6]
MAIWVGMRFYQTKRGRSGVATSRIRMTGMDHSLTGTEDLGTGTRYRWIVSSICGAKWDKTFIGISLGTIKDSQWDAQRKSGNLALKSKRKVSYLPKGGRAKTALVRKSVPNRWRWFALDEFEDDLK